MGIRQDQIDTVASEFEGAGTDNRELSLKGGAVSEEKLGFSWEEVEVLGTAFSFDSTRSNYTLSTAASSNANVVDQATLSRNGIEDLTRVTTTSAADEWSLSGTTLSIHGDITAFADKYVLRYIVGTASGAASSSGNLIWVGTVPQDPLQTESDYFQALELDSKWEEWDVPANTTVSVDGQGLLLNQTTAGGNSHAGVIQDAPSDNYFNITVRLRLSGVMTNYQVISLVAGEDLSAGTGNPSTASFFNAGLVSTGAGLRFEEAIFTNYSTFSTSTLLDHWDGNEIYARIHIDRVAETSTVLFSENGRDWIRLGSPRSWASGTVTSIDSIGISVNNNNSGADVDGRCDMFRVDITDDPYAVVGGFVGTSVPATAQDGPRDVTVAPDATVDQYGWPDRRVRLVKCEVFSAVPCTVGNYTFALTKDPNGTPLNMLSAATYDLTGLSAYTPTEVPLSSTADNITFDASDVWRAQIVSDNAGCDAEGVYFSLTWLVL